VTEPLDVTSPDRTNRSDLLWFGVWFAVGAAYALALLGAMTIGVFVLPFAVVATLSIRRHRQARVGLPGLVSGLALPLWYVAYLNRDGPGTVCSAIAGGQSCTDEWSPWPWLALGLGLLLAGVIVFARRRRPLPPGRVAISTDR
jgi:MYXO-CTERM domain-containing protein